MNNIFTPDLKTAKSLIKKFLGDEKFTINVFVVNIDECRSILESTKEDNLPVVITPVQRVVDDAEYVSKPSSRLSKGDIARIKKANRLPRLSELAGQSFSAERENVRVTIMITDDGKFYSQDTGKVYTEPNGAFNDLWTGKLEGIGSINAWHTPKNKHNRSIDQELELLGVDLLANLVS